MHESVRYALVESISAEYRQEFGEFYLDFNLSLFDIPHSHLHTESEIRAFVDQQARAHRDRGGVTLPHSLH